MQKNAHSPLFRHLRTQIVFDRSLNVESERTRASDLKRISERESGAPRLEQLAENIEDLIKHKQEIMAWLERFGERRSAAFLVALIIPHHERLPEIRLVAEKWLKGNLSSGRANVVITSIFSNPWDIQWAESQFLQWLARYPAYRQSGKLWCSWITLGSDNKQIEKALHELEPVVRTNGSPCPVCNEQVGESVAHVVGP